MRFRAFALALSLVVLSGCTLAKGPGSYYQQWRDGSPGERALMVGVGLCMVGLLYLVYHVSADDDDHDPRDGWGTRPCAGAECHAPPSDDVDYCFLGKDEHGLPC